MVKQPACAAARSSSGLVPLPSSNLLWKEYAVFERVPLAVEIEPVPDFRSPCHFACAVRFMRPLSTIGQPRKRLTAQPEAGPFVHRYRTECSIEADRRL